MKIYIGSDHNGYYLKQLAKEFLSRAGDDVVDDGDKELDPKDDFPIFAAKVVNNILSSTDGDARGILLCGSGQGMCMAANRYKGIRACLAWDTNSARASRNDDNSNILCIPAHLIDKKEIPGIIKTWLDTPFAGSTRFVRRIKEMDELN